MRLAGLVVVFLWFLLGGAGHFLHAYFFISIVPPYIPWPHTVVYASGVFELLGAAGLLLPVWRRAAGIGLFALTIAVTPANLNMALHPAQFSEIHLGGLTLYPSPFVLWFRMVIQVALLGCIYGAAIRPAKGVARRHASRDAA